MKNVQRILSTLAVIVTLALTSLVSVSSVAQDKKPAVPTKKELKTLLKTAKEPPEHLRIAAYYRQEAARLTASSKEHAQLAATYAKTIPNPMAAKHGDMAGQGTLHCKKWAEFDAEEAKQAEALATLHEDMAKAAGQKQQ